MEANCKQNIRQTEKWTWGCHSKLFEIDECEQLVEIIQDRKAF